MKNILLSFGFFVFGIYGLNAQCDNTLPVNEDFSNTFAVNSCWTYIDADGDGLGWSITSMDGSGNKGLKSKSFAGTALTPDNWIISNAIDLPSSSSIELSWKVRATFWQYDAENYYVYVANGNAISDFTSSSVMFTENLEGSDASGEFANRNLDLSSLSGQTVYIAFRHYGVTDQLEIDIDDFSVTGSGGCTDSDNDGVCDTNDNCPGYDDTVDSDGDGTPDGCDDTPNGNCNQLSKSFSVPNNTLTYSGIGTGETSMLLPADSQDISFTISGLEAKTKGKGSTQYIDLVDVTYNDGTRDYTTTYSGLNISSKPINIPGHADSISIKLYNGLSGSNQTISIALSDVTYCSNDNTPPCVDANNNGICDVDEPSGDCTPSIANFSNSTLSGTTSTTLSFDIGSQDISFVINNINDKQKGKPSGFYIEKVVVTYNDGILYGTYYGDQISSASVNISGDVSNVTVSLSNALGNNNSNYSISLGTISYCKGSGVSSKSTVSKSSSTDLGSNTESTSFKVYPNPASNTLYVKDNYNGNVSFKLYNAINGNPIRNIDITTSYGQESQLNINGITNGLYLLQVIDENGTVLKTERVVIK
ncbi:T9SS-dependent choice-of-anchor J family protein [Aestuariivivens sp. NBU2969]|uniref:T9SS-dependent choice-of-anchor J family protein n=1 Tax=Aestuariivivens sp. NBU2969 TaxID=2873267 RepID=UPI001CBD7357|nr:choice-of-anchor J domain-containing protein [Aestuariivivens sp. NBU2969]